MQNKHVEAFLESLYSERNASQNTIDSYKLDFDQWISFLSSIGITDVTSATYSELSKFFNYLSEMNMSVSTVQRKLSSLKQFYKFLVSENIISEDPTIKISRPKSKRPLPKIINEDDIRKLFEQVNQLSIEGKYRLELILLLLYGSGLRVSELVNLKQNCIEGRFLRIYGKGAKERMAPLSKKVVESFHRYISVCGERKWLFPSNKDANKHISRQRVFQLLKDIAIKSGLPYSALSPHILRHAFATHVLDNGADLLSVKKMLGHKSIAATEIYTHVSKKKLEDIVHKMHPLRLK